MDRDALIEQAAGAYREQRPDGSIADAPAWHDLSADERVVAHQRALATRRLEQALTGTTTTARRILSRLR